MDTVAAMNHVERVTERRRQADYVSRSQRSALPKAGGQVHAFDPL
jgi:hypothetical protein